MGKSPSSLLVITAGVLVLASACQHSPTVGNGGPPQRASPERLLLTVKARVMSADYRADLGELAHCRDEALLLSEAPEVGYLARYWAGFASWRLAINGVNNGMSNEQLKKHLEQAAAEFMASTGLRSDFADSYAAGASVNGWLGSLKTDESAVAQVHWARMGQLLARARELEPNNPRVLWVVGGDLLFKPLDYGGNPERAIEVYRRMLEVAVDPSPTSSPLPDWGKPEALMSLAYAHLNLASPDLDAAADEARAALDLQPEWSYVRDILLPQIETQRRNKFQRRS